MSETTTQDAPEQDPPDPADAPAGIAPTEPQADAPDPVQDPPKPNRGDRRFANLTARTVALEADLAAQQRRADAAEALLRAAKPDADPAPQPTVSRDALKAEVRFEAARDAVAQRGEAEFGKAAFAEQAAVLGSLGALQNGDFMAALVEMPNAEKIIAMLADDTDALLNLMKKTPAGMAAEMGRMSAKLETPTGDAPKPPVSRAPAPVTPIRAPVVVPETDPYQIKTADEWKEYRLKTARRFQARR